jgi:tetratricopeptide (TPR) repeat protein
MPFTNQGRRLSALRPGAVVAMVIVSAACAVTPQQREAKHIRNGKKYLAAKEYKKAAIEFKVASQNVPKDGEPLYQLGMTYLSAGAPQLALDAFQKAMTADPKHVAARYQVALFQVGTNHREQLIAAEQVLKNYLAAHPGDAVSAGALALAEAKLGNNEDAMKLLSTVGAQDAAHLRAASAVIALYTAKGDLRTAKEIALEISSQFPDSPGAAILRAQVSLAAQDAADADAEISRALALQEDFEPALELRLRRDLALRDQPGAEQTTQKLAKLPDRRTWSLYARMLFAERKYGEGAAEYDRVLKEHSGDLLSNSGRTSSLTVEIRDWTILSTAPCGHGSVELPSRDQRERCNHSNTFKEG